MMRAVEVNGSKDPEVSNTEDIEMLARAHGFPLKLSSIIEDKFDDIVHVFMTEHFKSAIPVSLFVQTFMDCYISYFRNTALDIGMIVPTPVSQG